MASGNAKTVVEVEPRKHFAGYIGVSVPRNFDGPAKTSGRAEYINDLSKKGMLYACILRSSIPHGRIKRIDYTELLKKDYIKAVITAENTSFSKIGPIRDNPPLKFEKVRSLQDEILAVATTDPARAKDDLERDVVVEYDELEPVFDPVRSMEKSAPLIHDETGSNIAKISFSTNSGNVDEAFKKSYYLREDEFDIPRVAFAPMGTLAALSEVDETGTLFLTSNTQQPFQLRRELAEALNIDPERVRIVQPYIGGTFGRGMALQPFEVITAELALRTGKPVKAQFTRSEDFKFSPTRQPVKIKIKTGTSRDGIILARDVTAIVDTGSYVSYGAFDARVMAATVNGLYRVENERFTAFVTYTNNPYTINLRGAGNPQMDFALESHLDSVASDLGIDPVEFRKMNSYEGHYVTPQNMIVNNANQKKALEIAAELIGWTGRHAIIGRGPYRYGIGFSGLFHVGGGARVYHTDGSGAFITIDDFGNVTLYTGISEIGQGSIQSLSQIVASELGVELEKVSVVYKGDSSVRPWDTATHASRGTFSCGRAAQIASRKLKNEILKDASEFFKEDLNNLELTGGNIFSKADPQKKIELSKFIRRMHFRNDGKTYVSDYYFDPATEMADESNRGNISSSYVTGATAALVEVDVETGKVKPLKIVCVNDCGKIINPRAAKGQIIGGIAQAVGHTLYEELIVQDGRVENPGFLDYEVPGVSEIPEIIVEFIETESEEGPFGAKGVAEMGIIGTPAAINNAVFDATGIRLKRIPLQPEELVREFEKASGGEHLIN